MMNRRDVIKMITVMAAGTKGIKTCAALTDAAVPTLYYMDGYHGGIRGHMPEGSWRDILNALRLFKDWKVSLDIEPMSWPVLCERDPQAFHEIAQYLHDESASARVEMVGGTFSQPYGWAISGESNIRQMQYGLQVIRESFPGLDVSIYAVQEPCWTSCLPQILSSLRFKGAVLRDASTAWCGYSAGLDAEIVQWIGPDGSALPAVPRYACEDVESVYATESVDATPEFVCKCLAHGIKHPAGMCFQDLGWAAKPQASAPYIRYATWREYFGSIAIKPVKQWRYSIEDILVTLPWGQPDLQRVARQVRASENKLVHAERLAAIAFLTQGMAWPAEQFNAAWVQLMYMQSHDAWICATTGEGRKAQVFQADARTMEADELADGVVEAAKMALSTGSMTLPQDPLGAQFVRVMNTTAMTRTDIVEVALATDRGTQGIMVTDEKNRPVPYQLQVTRPYYTKGVLQVLSQTHASEPDDIGMKSIGEQINDAVVLFCAEVPPMGYSTYRLTPLYTEHSEERKRTPFVTTESTGVWTIESDLYRIKIDPRCGGGITQLYAKEIGQEFCSGEAGEIFNEYRGYFIEQKKWCSSANSLASIEMVEQGPVRITVRIEGKVGEVPYETLLSVTEGQSRIDLKVRFTYEQDTWIGQPIDIAPDARETQGKRSQNNGKWKLQALFPVAFKQSALYKNAAFDVCRSRNKDTCFEDWKDIKHNILVNWVDLVDESQDVGLALFCDHTTGYNLGPDDPLGLVLGWAWDGGFWWTKRPLRGVQEIAYALMPHKGLWDSAHLVAECERQASPLEAQIVDGDVSSEPLTYSLLQSGSKGVHVSAMTVSGSDLLVRLWNPESSQVEHEISFSSKFAEISVVELDGREVEKLAVHNRDAGGCMVKIRIPQFALRTLRCSRSPLQQR